MKRSGWLVALAAALFGVGCGNGPSGPAGDTGRVSLSFMIPGVPGAAAADLLGAGLVLGPDANGNSLEILSAEVVLRDIEFEYAVDLPGCDADEGGAEGSDDDACEEFNAGPELVSLPLAPGVVIRDVMVDDVPAGDYEEIELDVHKLGDDPADLAFLGLHDGFEGISIRVAYRWNGDPEAVFTSDVDAEHELEVPFTVAAGTVEVGVTLSVDLSSWFVDGTGNYIDPASAMSGGANESRVEGNIHNSFEAFEDDDKDGVPHDMDDDEHDD